MKRVSWVSFGRPVRKPDGTLTSDLASLRYRVLSPIRALGHDAYVHKLITMTAGAPEAVKDAALAADVLIFSKSFLPANEDLARQAQARGVSVVFDVCDNHYQHPEHGPHYRRMSALADRVVCNSPAMAAAAGEFSAREPSVIEDPCEGVRAAPAFAPDDTLKLLWFGHPSNLDSLQAALPDLVDHARRRPLSLTLLTQPDTGLERLCQALTDRFRPCLTLALRPWSLEAQALELGGCDAVVIPSLQTPGKQVKSANRMIEALWAGRPVVAQPIPAYAEFARWTPVVPSLSDGLARLAQAPAAWPARIAEAQAHIERYYAPAALAPRWAQVIDAAGVTC